MREEDVLCGIRGHLELRQMKRSAAMGTGGLSYRHFIPGERWIALSWVRWVFPIY